MDTSRIEDYYQGRARVPQPSRLGKCHAEAISRDTRRAE